MSCLGSLLKSVGNLYELLLIPGFSHEGKTDWQARHMAVRVRYCALLRLAVTHKEAIGFATNIGGKNYHLEIVIRISQ